ncbi:hypothetical protein [Bradyrhizobium sp. CCBAU 051011]|uniref:hypothetical protein n=1 Tax=Bradyrhizobium sp. CCBAU 051011 TaxID=858422 RepID=UPI00352B0668
MSPEEDLVGSVRLLPTTGPTMLRDNVAARLGTNQIPSGPTCDSIRARRPTARIVRSHGASGQELLSSIPRLQRDISLVGMIVEFGYAADLNAPGHELSDGSTTFSLDMRKLWRSKLENSAESHSNISGSAGMRA